MELTRLGPDGPEISRIGFGGCPIGGHGWGRVDDRESLDAINRALGRGVNFFDTADVYGLGHSEEVLSRGLGDRRSEVIVATKFGVARNDRGETIKDTSPRHLRKAIEVSLRRLRLDCVPLYYVHWPDGVTPIEETMVELLRCRDEGKIRWIGLSNMGTELVERALKVGPVHALQVQFSLVDREAIAELLPVAERSGITLVTWGSLAQGLLTGKYDARSRFDPSDRRSRYENFVGPKFERNLRVVDRLVEIARRLGRTPAQVALRWVLDYPVVGSALFGAKRPGQVDDNLGSIGWRLPTEDFESLASVGQEAAVGAQ